MLCCRMFNVRFCPVQSRSQTISGRGVTHRPQFRRTAHGALHLGLRGTHSRPHTITGRRPKRSPFSVRCSVPSDLLKDIGTVPCLSHSVDDDLLLDLSKEVLECPNFKEQLKPLYDS